MGISGKELSGVLLSVLLWGWVISPNAGAAINKPDIDKKITAVAAYKQADDRAALIAVERLIRQSQGDPEQRKYIENALARLLESDVSTECREFVCRRLSFIGTADSVPAVAKLLTDEKTVDMACYAIGRNPSAEAGKALRDALEKAGPAVQIRIINLLGDREDAESVETLGSLALAADTQIAQAAVAALGKIGGTKAAQFLVKARAGEDEELRLAATDAYLQCAEDLADAGSSAAALNIYKELTAKNEAPFTRSAAIQGLANVAGPDAVALVVAALKDANRMVRTTAAGCVRTMQGPGVTELFAAQLAISSPADQVLLIAAMADRGDPAALDAITKTAKSSDANVRKASLAAIGRLGAASSVDFLADTAKAATDTEERKTAINSLTMLRGRNVDDTIVKNMQKAQGPLRAELIGVLSERNAAGAVHALLTEAGSQDSNVRRAAFKALGRLAGRNDLPSLLSLLVDIKGSTGRRDAERAVAAAARRIPDANDQADAVLRKLRGAERIEVRTSLLRVLGGIGNNRALDAIRTALADTDPQVRDAAVRTLSAWPNPAAAQTLLQIYLDSKSSVHRILSLRGLVRILTAAAEKYPPERAVEIYRRAIDAADAQQDKKLVLSGLANLAHIDALEIALASLDDQTVRTEAALAAVKIAAAIAPSKQNEAKAATEKVLTITTSEAVRKQAQQLIEAIDPLRGRDAGKTDALRTD